MAIIENLINSLPEFYNTDEDSYIYQVLYSIAIELEVNNLDIIELRNRIQIDTSYDSYLEDIAKVYRINRQDNEDNETLRSRIKSFFSSNTGSGTSNGIITAISNFTGLPENNITIIENNSMKISVQIALTDTTPDSIISLISDTLEVARAAGIYTGGARFTSANNVFRLNLSEINGEDMVI